MLPAAAPSDGETKITLPVAPSVAGSSMPWLTSPRIVGDDDDLLAHELLGLIVLPQAGTDLALFRAEVDLEDEQLVGVGVGLAFEDGRDAELELGEVVRKAHSRHNVGLSTGIPLIGA